MADWAESRVRNRLAEDAGCDPADIQLEDPIEKHLDDLALVTLLTEVAEERGSQPDDQPLITVADLIAHVREAER